MNKKLIGCALAAAMLSSTAAFAQEDVLSTNGLIENLVITDMTVTSEETAVLLNPFEDISETDYFYETVLLCQSKGIVGGTSPTQFSPWNLLTEDQCAAICARMLASQLGETLDESYDKSLGETWYTPVLRYLSSKGIELNAVSGVQCTRARFLSMLGAVVADEYLEQVYPVTSLPDTEDETVLKFYRAGILNGMDIYGSFQPTGTLRRGDAATMVARILDPELRVVVTPSDYSPFRAADVTPSTVFFNTSGGSVTAKTYLGKLNELIEELETACEEQEISFNWYNTVDEQTFLDYVTETALNDLGVTKNQGTTVYQNFDVQVYYSRLLTEWQKNCPSCQEQNSETPVNESADGEDVSDDTSTESVPMG